MREMEENREWREMREREEQGKKGEQEIKDPGMKCLDKCYVRVSHINFNSN